MQDDLLALGTIIKDYSATEEIDLGYGVGIDRLGPVIS